jgi:hypothetical protein
MRKFNKFRPHALAAPVESRQRWMRSRTFRSLLIAVAGALMLMAAFVPSAKADLIAYFNFEDSTKGGPPDFTSEADQGLGIDTTIVTNYDPDSMNSVTPGINLNVVAGDADPNNLSVHLFRSGMNDPADFDIPLFSSQGFFQDMTVSFAINVMGNGFETVTLWYSIDGGTTFINSGNFASILTGGEQVISLAVPVAANNAPLLVLRLEFTGGQSNGVNDQDIIDNIQVNGTIVPEPATVAGGLLGVLGLCWYQRRRLRSVLPRLRRG